jgi:hypothetical protein
MPRSSNAAAMLKTKHHLKPINYLISIALLARPWQPESTSDAHASIDISLFTGR